MLLGGIRHPLYRRRLVDFEMHDERQNVFQVEPWEIMGVNRFHWNGNLQLFLTPHPVLGYERMGYVSYGTPWRVECYSPKGKMVRVITEADCPPI